MRTGIYGHTSEETAYLIEDYPYGRLRCQRKVWLESDPKRGVRFVAQTNNPKNGRWNKPHKSTYADIAGCLYLDAEKHVQWAAIGFYSKPEEALAFAQDFGKNAVGADQLLHYAMKRARVSQALADGKAHFTINNEKQERSETDKSRDAQESQVWVQVVELLVNL